MRLSRELASCEAPLALAIGNFDGVHLGHRQLLDRTVEVASRRGWLPAALSFVPSPREFFARARSETSPARLMSAAEKLAAMHAAGIAHSIVLRFDAAFAAQSPPSFLQRLGDAGVRWLIVGEDFRFGAKRAGDAALLRAWSEAHGIEVETAEAVTDDAGQRISSSSVREALRDGRLTDAARLLGRPYRIVGRIVHGRKLGRTLGFPTANVSLTGRKPALGGVFAVQCRLVTRGLEGVAGRWGEYFDGVANLGTNPAVSSESRQHLEVFLFSIPPDRDLYGQRLEVVFIEKIRDERHFAGPDALDALAAQMRDDAEQAQRILLRMKDDGRNEEGLQKHA